MDLSNKALALILVVTVVVSLFGAFLVAKSAEDVRPQYFITGRAPTDTGTANFSINTSISVVFTTDNANFGVGQVNGSGTHTCTLNTSLTNGIPNEDCWGFNDYIPALVIQNQGTLNVSLNVSFNSTAAQFIGGTSPSLTYKFSANDSAPCGPLVTANTEVPDADNQSICPSTAFNWETGSRTLNLDIGVDLPQDTTPGARTLLITAHAANP